MEKEKTNEIRKYKKVLLIYRILMCLLAIASLFYLLIVIFTNPDFNTNYIIALSIFGGFTLLSILSFVIYDMKRYKLIEKYYGKVSTEDMKKSKVLLSKIAILKRGEYSFLDSEQFEYDDKMLKLCLKQISKGHKVYFGLVKICSDIKDEIKKSPEKHSIENQYYNTYISELADLFERNSCDI
ncbi:MAG: hypothetical protein NC132_01055 [Corallococcus sp.]|nr:hypothetical protein [Corallococcus sp.]MCM1359493.1 hypothetical protein [Corallococcus sp.]MCM1394695.1 hypothetical protein [Corallococcus sp.]